MKKKDEKKSYDNSRTFYIHHSESEKVTLMAKSDTSK